MLLTHQIAMFVQNGLIHHWHILVNRGPNGWIMSVQPHHRVGFGIARLFGHFQSWGYDYPDA